MLKKKNINIYYLYFIDVRFNIVFNIISWIEQVLLQFRFLISQNNKPKIVSNILIKKMYIFSYCKRVFKLIFKIFIILDIALFKPQLILNIYDQLKNIIKKEPNLTFEFDSQ